MELGLLLDLLALLCFSSITGEMDEVDAFRIKRHTEDTVSIAPSTAESVIVEGEGVGVCGAFSF